MKEGEGRPVLIILIHWQWLSYICVHRLRVECGQGWSFSRLYWKKVPWGPLANTCSLPRVFLCGWTTLLSPSFSPHPSLSQSTPGNDLPNPTP